MPRKLNNETFDEKICERFIKRIDNYCNSKTKIRFMCLAVGCNYVWEALPDSILSGRGCSKCSNRIKITNEIVDSRLIDSNIIRVGNFVSANTKINFKCKNILCNNIWMATPGNIFNAKIGCLKCSKNIKNKEFYNSLKLNDVQKEVLAGLMLGDGHLSLTKGGSNAKLEIGRTATDKDYILNHKEVFNEFLTDKPIYEKSTFDIRTNKTYYSVRLRTRCHPAFTEYQNIWYQDRIKIVPKDLVLTPLVIATWLADDGHFQIHTKYGKIYENEIRIKIATNGFSKEETYFLANLLEEKYKCHFAIYKASTTKEHYYIMITKRSDVQKIIQDIDPFFPKGMERKSDMWRKTNYLNIK